MCGFGVTFTAMRRFASFYWQCIKQAARGCTPAANDWQWLIGFPILAVVLWLINLRYGEGTLTLSQDTAMGALGAAGAAFILTSVFTFMVQFARAPVKLFYEAKTQADDLSNQLRPKLVVVYDKTIRPCKDVTTFVGVRRLSVSECK
jgi:hypothetical protein